MSKALDSQRTYALIGTGGCGKTSLAEMLLFQSGVINRLGAIEEGTTTLDYEPEEIKRRGSPRSSSLSPSRRRKRATKTRCTPPSKSCWMRT